MGVQNEIVKIIFLRITPCGIFGRDSKTGLQKGAFKKCPSRAFIRLKFLEAEKVMNKKLN